MGIDYGRGTTNIDKSTGIRYGVIPQNDVLQAWADSSEPVYPEPEECQCETCGGDGKVDDEECLDCAGTGTVEPDMDGCEPLGFVYNAEGYRAQCGDCGDIFITKSPFYTCANYCSPCAPGAIYLRDVPNDPENADATGYCFGHDWFEEGKAPYRVFRVGTDEEVFPEPK